MPQGVSYVHQDHKPANLYIRNTRRCGHPSSAAPGPIGVGRPGKTVELLDRLRLEDLGYAAFQACGGRVVDAL
jgi:hypothetical protein